MQMTRFMRCALAGALLAAMSAIPATAQNIFGAIVGTVSDSGGAVLPGAAVVATSIGTGEKRTATTDGQGNYEILSLPRGEYKIDVNATGFKHFTRSPIDVLVDQQARVNVQMVIGEQIQNVVVTAAPPIMQTDSASLGQVVEGKAVQTLPLNGRNVLGLVTLVPGVVALGNATGSGTATANLSGLNVFAAGNYAFSGGSANQGAVLVDGAPVNTSYGNNVVLVMDQDVIQEFNVQTHNNTAEFGMYNGGIVNMSTRSGTNAFHGEAYEYLRNTVLDANNFFANRAGSGRQEWHQNQFGANVGGPLKHNKLFFFVDYQGFRETYGQPVIATVPTPAEISGDFSAYQAAIYDPTTTCGFNANPACTPAQQAGTAPTRQQFSYQGRLNVIPPGRMSTVAKNMLAFPIFAKPNVAGTMTPWGPVNNFSVLSTAGGTNDQLTFRGDQNISSKQTAFERYTWWKSKTIADHPWGNGLGDNSVQPDDFTTQQAVVGDTFIFSPTSIMDVNLSYLNWNYNRTPPDLGFDAAATFGLPSYMNFGALNGFGPSTGVPEVLMSGSIAYTQGAAGLIQGMSNDYAISATYQKVWKQHTFKVGLDLRRYDLNYYQTNFPGGVFAFDSTTTAQSVSTAGISGNPLASMELGYMGTQAGGASVQISPPVFQRLYYQGYFVQDSWVPTNKLTLTLGLRYELPGDFIAGHGWNDTFNPTEINPVILANTGLSVPGAFDLVNTPNHPNSGTYKENWNDWSPRLGFAYRVTNNTVLRGSWGRFIVPEDVYFGGLPLNADVNSLTNSAVSTINGEQTPNNYQNGVYTNQNTLDNPFPNGLEAPPHRNPNYQAILLGGSTQANLPEQPNGETYQWNVAVEHQFPMGIAVTAAYVGLQGEHLPLSGPTYNAVPDNITAQAAADPNCSKGNFQSCFLLQQVKNPYYPFITQGNLKATTVTQSQMLRPFPQYASIGSSAGRYIGVSDYNALQMTVQKRWHNGGQVLGSYTFSKLMTNAETVTTWLDTSGGGVAGFQDYNNLPGEYSLSSSDPRQNLVVSYMYPLPIGQGQLLLPHLSSVANAFIGGWGLEGIASFRDGFPLGLSVANDVALGDVFQGTQRPNVVAGCGKQTSGSMYDRLGGAGSKTTYFNTSCFTQPSYFSFGNESRTDNTLRTPGVDNWDMSLFKDFPVHEQMTLNVRVEAFNLFNRVQFGTPDTGLNHSTFGWITTQANNPRILQLSGRFSF
jgi:outer membrane receptor protein involved in Fe transport